MSTPKEGAGQNQKTGSGKTAKPDVRYSTLTKQQYFMTAAYKANVGSASRSGASGSKKSR